MKFYFQFFSSHFYITLFFFVAIVFGFVIYIKYILKKNNIKLMDLICINLPANKVLLFLVPIILFFGVCLFNAAINNYNASSPPLSLPPSEPVTSINISSKFTLSPLTEPPSSLPDFLQPNKFSKNAPLQTKTVGQQQEVAHAPNSTPQLSPLKIMNSNETDKLPPPPTEPLAPPAYDPNPIPSFSPIQ